MPSPIEQLGHRLQIPERVVGVGMAEIGRQPDHLARRVLAGPVPVDHRPHGEAVAKVVDARSPAMPAIALLFAQADLLAGLREVVACAAVGQPCSAAGDEEGLRTGQTAGRARQHIDELRHDRRVEREQPLPAELAAPHAGARRCRHRGRSRSSASASLILEAGDRDEPEQGRAGQSAQAVDRGQCLGRRDDRGDLGLAVDIRARAARTESGSSPRGGTSWSGRCCSAIARTAAPCRAAPSASMCWVVIRQQSHPRGLRFGQRRRLCHADVDQMLCKPAGEIVEVDSAALVAAPPFASVDLQDRGSRLRARCRQHPSVAPASARGDDRF